MDSWSQNNPGLWLGFQSAQCLKIKLGPSGTIGMLIDHFQPAGLLPATIFFVFWWPVFAGKAPATVAGALEMFSSIYSHYLPATVAGFNTFFLGL